MCIRDRHKGLPVYSGQPEKALTDLAFFCHGPACFENILEFANSINNIDRMEVSEVARPLIDKRIILETMYEKIGNIVLDKTS